MITVITVINSQDEFHFLASFVDLSDSGEYLLREFRSTSDSIPSFQTFYYADAGRRPLPPSPPSVSPEVARRRELVARLLLAPTGVDRAALLTPEDHVFDFLNPPEGATTTGLGGRTVRADRGTFPALVGTGVGMTLGFLGPCGFNTPHTHPRSSEANVIVQGTLVIQFIAENGVAPVSNTLSLYQLTVLPKGALHLEFNPNCDDAVFVAGFGDEDFGVEQAAQSLFGLDPEVVKATLNLTSIPGSYIEAFRNALPANVALSVETCLKKCGIKRKPLFELRPIQKC